MPTDKILAHLSLIAIITLHEFLMSTCLQLQNGNYHLVYPTMEWTLQYNS